MNTSEKNICIIECCNSSISTTQPRSQTGDLTASRFHLNFLYIDFIRNHKL
ncbi:hypothetical protein MOUN0_I00166 [Monosporozyma unispora]